jgi:predicted DNA-binding transcriptional regulator AlpA
VVDLTLNGEIWGVAQVAEHLQVPKSSVYRIAKQPGFPRPIAGFQRNRRWASKAVRAYCESYDRQLDSSWRAIEPFDGYPNGELHAAPPMAVTFSSRKRAS